MDGLISEQSIRQKILLETKRTFHDNKWINISGKNNAINIYESNKEHGVKSSENSNKWKFGGTDKSVLGGKYMVLNAYFEKL